MQLPIQTESWLITAVGIAAIYVTSIIINWAWRSRRPKNYPPGPPSLPFVGNAFQVPLQKQYLKFTELRKDYGDIVGLKFGVHNIVVLNSARIVHELLEKRHDIYSGRSRRGVVPHVLRDGPHVTVSEGEYLRQWRTAARLVLRPSGLREMLPLHAASAAFCVHKIMNSQTTDDIFRALENWALTGPMKAVCGVSGAQRDPEWMKWYYTFAEENLDILEPAAIPPLDVFPMLHYVPKLLAPWKVIAERVFHAREVLCNFTLECARDGYEKFKTAAARGEKVSYEGLMARVLREQTETGKSTFSDEQMRKVGGGLLEASIGTTLASFRCWLKILLAHPEVVAKIQEELDTVCGASGPPQGEHLDSLPYLKACLQEAWRWRIPTPVSLPHRLTKDDYFEGHFIPKDSVIVQNNYCILKDPDFFDSPEDFIPERYLDNPAGTKKGVAPGPYHRSTSFIFGAGRRMCPGDGFSAQSMLLLMGKLLWACDLVADGPVDVSIEGFHGETVMDPWPWKMKCVPRNEARAAAAEADRKALEPLLV